MTSLSPRWARVAWLVVLVFPILLNAPELLGILKADPVLSYSYLQAHVVPGPIAIHPIFDPSVGVDFQPLGKRAAEELLHGQMPWWNSFQGIGAPLAGEMNPGAFFPLIFLELLPNGQIILNVAVQILAGVCLLLLARRLGLGLFAGAVGAVLFEMNGTFAWLNSGWCYPLPFLPLLIYGVELGVSQDLRERIGGTVIVALSVALSICAAMIEVAYLDGLLAVAWAILRLAQTYRSGLFERFLRLALGAVAGILLATPQLLAFCDFLSVSYVGMHGGDGAGPGGPDVRGLAQLILPYFLGPVFYNDSGYGGAAVVLVAVCGLFGKYLRGVRLLLGAWVFVAVSVTMGSPYLSLAFYSIPGVRYTAYNRYLDGSWEFALALLVAFFMYDLARHAGRLWVRYASATAVVLLTVCIGVSGSRSTVSDSFSRSDYTVWCWTSVAWGLVAVGILWLTKVNIFGAKGRLSILVCALGVEAVVNYSIPSLGYPLQATLVEGPVDFLRDHLGLQRFFTLGPLSPNYGAFFDVAELDDAELPVARTWADFMSNHLDSLANQGWVNGQDSDEIAKNINWYEDTGMKYLMTVSGSIPYENFVEPFDSKVAALAINLLDSNIPVRVQLGSVPAGSLAAVSIVEGNYGGSADGRIHLHVCSQHDCVDGRRPFSESPNNAPFWVILDRPLDVTGNDVSITITQEGAKISDALWLYGRDAKSNQRVTVSGKEVKDRVAQIALAYNSLIGDPLIAESSHANVSNKKGEPSFRATVRLAEGVAQYANAVGVSGIEPSRVSQGKVCSLGHCANAALATARGDGRYAWFALETPLRVRDSIDVSLQRVAQASRPIDIRLDISTERPTPVYHDDVVDIFEMPHPADYFSAPNCVLAPQARERVTAECLTPSQLTRRELYLPGWSATLDGRSAEVRPMSTIFQSVSLPAGESSVTFSFEPPFMSYGYAAFTLALLALGYQTFVYLRLGRRTADR